MFNWKIAEAALGHYANKPKASRRFNKDNVNFPVKDDYNADIFYES